MEAAQRVAGTPRLPSLVAQVKDLQLAPGVPAVGRVEWRAARLGQRGRPGQVRVRLEPAGAFLHGHPGGVQADGAGEPGDPDECLQPDADREPRVVSAEPFLDAEFLRIMCPALDERLGVQRPPYL